ncbi:MAG: filamentous hemagglutinin N-terminal domain-containing protein [Selenomonas bovis]|nr:filamentous hemagglutinin N-terminal domain-containing protein [Selenomonas bovis]
MRKERVARKERLALQVGIALTAGVFGTLPTAEGAPVLDKVVTAGTQVAQSGSITDVTGTQQNNIVKWTDFSVNQGETVRFDKGAQEKNYLNLVTGPKTSEIAGTIEGGKDVYLVNPHGVIFSHGAQVNVGNLYVSTENTDAALKAFNAGKTAGAVLTAGTANADVVNLGGIAASSVVVNGDNIRFLTDDVQATQVTLQAAKSIVQEQDAARSAMPGVLRAASPSAASPGYVLHAPQTESRRAIFNAKDLAAVKNHLSDSYSLEADLTLNGSYTPIGDDKGAFTGKFDGNFHTISGIQVSGGTYGGLFGLTSDATIQNVGVKDGAVTAVHAGGIVGKAVSTTLTDVYNAGVSVEAIDNGTDYGGFSAGGIIGYADGSQIEKVYNTGNVKGDGAGLIGCVVNGTHLMNAYNTGVATYAFISYAPPGDTSSNISYAYATNGNPDSSFYAGTLDSNTVFSVTSTSKDTSLKTYKDKNFSISSSGSDNTVWRIYEGHSLPLLRDFLRRGKGAVTVSYDYAQGSNKGTINGSDLTLTYNNQDVKLSNINYTNANGLSIDKSKITQDIGDLHDANRYSNKDGRLAFYCTSQDGYDLVGGHIYIDQRTVNISGANISGKTVEKKYDGGADASAAVAKLFTGDSTSVSGIIAGDDSISLDTNAVNAYFIDEKGNRDASVGANKDVWVDGTISIKNADGKNNYKIDKESVSLHGTKIKGTITQKDIVVDFATGKGTGIDKTYDGASTVADAYKPSDETFSYADQIVKKTDADGTSKPEDAVLTYAQDANYVAADLKTKEKSAGSYQDRVQYSGLKLTGNDAQNYRLVDKSGNVLWDVKTNRTGEDINKDTGGSLYGSGAIRKRNFSSAGFSWYKKDGTKQDAVREYTHESGYTEPVGSLVDTERVSSTAAAKQGLITGDDVKFTVTGAEFTTSATDAGASAAYNVKDAKGVRYQVDISGTDVANYTMDGKEITSSGRVIGKGSITPRTIYLAANRGVDKTYDGDNKVRIDGQVPTSVSPDAADSLVGYASTDAKHQLVNGDGAVLSLNGSTYAQADVLYKDGLPAAQQITYKVSVMQDGAVSQNYKINTASDADAVAITTLQNGKAVTGIIRPRTLTDLTFKDVSKTYDGKAAVRGLQATDKVQLQSVSGIQQPAGGTAPTLGDLIDLKSIQGTYGKKNGDTFTENPHVKDAAGSKEKDVRYTGIQLRNAEGNYNFGTKADGRNITETTAYGKGRINAAKVGKKDIIALFAPITKIYDGSSSVAYDHTAGGYDGQEGDGKLAPSHKASDYLKALSILGIKLENGVDYDIKEATYRDASGNKTEHAGGKHGATQAEYTLELKGNALKNFTFGAELGNGFAAYTGEKDGVATYNGTAFYQNGVLTERPTASIQAKYVLAQNTDTSLIEKTYDGTTALLSYVGGKNGAQLSQDTLGGRFAFTGILAGDSVNGAVAGEYADKNVVHTANGIGKIDINYKLSLQNNEARDYQLVQDTATGKALTTYTGEKQGLINPRQLDFAADYAEREFDGTADAEVKNGRFTEVRDAQGQTVADTGLVSGENLTPGTDVKAQYGSLQNGVFVADGNVNGKEDYKGIRYEGLKQALEKASGQSETIKASNYTIADTKYFEEAKKQGKIKRLALSASDIKTRWEDVVKQYDGTTAVESPEEKFLIYINEVHRKKNGIDEVITLPKAKEIHLQYDLKDAAYDAAGAGKASSVTYEVSGLKNSDKLANNFTFTNPNDKLDLAKYQGRFTLLKNDDGTITMWKDGVQSGTSTAKVGITKRVLRVHADGHNDKTYDGNAAADAGHLVLADGTDGKLAQDIANILQNDKTDLASHVVANYMATGGAQETAAAANVGAKHDASQGEGGKVVAYTVDLAAGKDLTANYALDTSQAAADGVTNQVKDKGTEQQGTYIGHGDILRRVVYVSFADPKAENRKEYDGTPTVTDTADDRIRAFALSDEDAVNKTGIIHADKGTVSVTGATGTYDTAHVKRNDKSGEELKGHHTVTYSGFKLENVGGSDNAKNYEVAAADGRTDEQGNAVLVGEGTITPAKLHVSLKDEKVTQVYDNTTDVEDLDKYGEANIQKTEGDLKIRDTVNVKLSGKPQYDNKDANVIKGKQTENRSVTYELEWDNPDYELAVAQDAPSQKLHVEQEVSATDVGKARLVTNAATIKPRTVTISANPDPAKWATRLYDGKSGGAAESAIENLKADNLAKGEKLINLFLKPGATKESYLPETVLRSAYDSNPNAGKDGVAIDGDGNDLRNLREHTVTYTYTLQNPNYQLDEQGHMEGTANGKGVIRRKEITVTADPKTMTVGSSLPAFTGSASGFVSTDAAEQAAFEADLQFRPADGVVSPPVGKYGVYGWYRTQEKQEITVPAVLEDGKVLTPEYTEEKLVDVWKHKEGNLGLNYYFGQDQANDTALTVVARSGGGGGGGWTPVKPPVTPVKPPVTPVKPPVTPVEPVTPAVPPRALEEALVPAKKFVPDGNSYHRASLDLYHEVVRTPVAGLEYTTGGINMGTVDSGSTETGTASLEGSGDVVNLGNAGSAVVDVTRADTSFTVSGEEAVRGVTADALTALAVQTAGSGAASATGGAGVGSTGSMLSTEAVTADGHATTGAEPADAAAAHGGAPAAGVTLFHDASEGYPGHLAATEDAHLFDDAVPAVTAAGEAHVSLFDDSSETAGREHSSHDASGAAVSLFGDEPAAQPASGAGISASGAVKAQTSSADEEDEKEKEEAAHAAALKAKGADIGIESEGAGVNLAG